MHDGSAVDTLPILRDLIAIPLVSLTLIFADRIARYYLRWLSRGHYKGKWFGWESGLDISILVSLHSLGCIKYKLTNKLPLTLYTVIWTCTVFRRDLSLKVKLQSPRLIEAVIVR